ncbi:MAG TPA: hypothetical protein VLT36_12080 [Candidatus Dormibacteraeota bacterium]|nr:hypothetical protein [Candidatus Dormibacteraeota bacterium]
MKLKTQSQRRKPVYFTLPADYEKRMANIEAACRRPRADLAREWAQERLDLIDFPCLEFRSSSKGRFAVVRGTRLAVWHMALLARTLGWGKKLASHLEIVPEAVASAEAYSRRHYAEIQALIAANEQTGFDELKQTFPNLRRLDEAAS